MHLANELFIDLERSCPISRSSKETNQASNGGFIVVAEHYRATSPLHGFVEGARRFGAMDHELAGLQGATLEPPPLAIQPVFELESLRKEEAVQEWAAVQL
jgi:hypothetical protein